jgi:hypothetical protein
MGTRSLTFYGLRVKRMSELDRNHPSSPSDRGHMYEGRSRSCSGVPIVRVGGESRETTDRRRLIDNNKQRLAWSARLQRKHRRLGHLRPHVE